MVLSTRMLVSALGYYLRHVGPHPGRWRLQAAAMKRSGALKGQLRPTVTHTSAGFRVVVDGNSQAGRVLYITGRYEPEVTAQIERLLRPGDLMIDGGAHIGFFTLLASRRVGQTGRVMAFEPSSAIAQVLQQNVQLNGCTNVAIVQCALGDRSGKEVLAQASTTETGQATLRSISQPVATTDVDVVALDDLLVDETQRVALIKLDLEGAELRALSGMTRVLSRDRPHVIVEVTDRFLKQAGGSAVDLYSHLTRFGYLPHVIKWDAVRPVSSAEAFVRCGEQFNALFMAPPRR